MKVPVAQATELSIQILTGRGLPREDAETVTDILIEAELRGRATHGLIRLKGLASHIAASAPGDIQVVKEAPTSALVDGGGNLGYLVAQYAMRLAISKASPLAVVGACNTNHSGMLGYYPLMAARRALIGAIACDTFRRTAPFGATEAVLGTNALAVAIPTESDPILIDMSTAAITNGQLIVASKAGQAIPEGVALDAEGRPTTDPQAAQDGCSLAFGGHKGSALSLLGQIMTSALVNADPLPQPGRNYGLFLLALDPSAFVPLDQFKASVAEITVAMKAAPRAEGVAEILIPGERSNRERSARLKTGLDIDDDLWQELTEL